MMPNKTEHLSLFQEDDQLRRKAEGGGSSGAASGLQELLPFAGGAAAAQSLRKVAAHDRERQEMLKVRVCVRACVKRGSYWWWVAFGGIGSGAAVSATGVYHKVCVRVPPLYSHERAAGSLRRALRLARKKSKEQQTVPPCRPFDSTRVRLSFGGQTDTQTLLYPPPSFLFSNPLPPSPRFCLFWVGNERAC